MATSVHRSLWLCRRQLRGEGKQIPQRRVDGDGDLALARREQPAATPPDGNPAVDGQAAREQAAQEAMAGPARPKSPGPRPGPSGPGGGTRAALAAGLAGLAAPQVPGSAGGGTRRGASRRVVTLAAVAVAAAAGGAIAAVLLTSHSPAGTPPGGGYSSPGTFTSAATFTETAPWRLTIDGRATTASQGCSVWVVDARTGAVVSHLADGMYGVATFQVSDRGTFRWRVTEFHCAVTILPGSGTASLPLNAPAGLGDTDAFAAPAKVTVQVRDWGGGQSCHFAIYDPDTGAPLDFQNAELGQNDTVTLDPGGHKSAYLALDGCGVRVSAGT